jgi:hypothetical protein
MPVRLVRSRARPATLQSSRGSSRYRQVFTMASPGPLTAKANSRPGSLAVTVQVVQ